MTTVAIITIVSIVIIVALAVAGLYVWGENVNLRRENSALILAKGKAPQEAFAGAKKIQAELDSLKVEFHKLELKYIDLDGELVGVRKEKETLQLQLDNARERLAKFDRIRGEGGKFVRPDGTYTPYEDSEPAEAIELPTGVKMEEVEVVVSCTGGPDIENELSHE